MTKLDRTSGTPARRRRGATAGSPATSAVRKAVPGGRTRLSRERILSIATKLFAERGFAAVSMRDIAEACDVNLPSIYHFFGDKDRLYDACYRATFEAAAEVLHEAVSNASTAQQRIDDFTVKLCEILMENHDFRRLLQREFLREERRHITVLTTHHFRREFKLMTAAIAATHGSAQAMERCFAIYGLALGLLQMRRIGELAGMDKSIASTPQNLAAHVLRIVLPPKPRARARTRL